MRIAATPDNIGKHVFEVTKCGVAPFTFMYVWEMPSTSLMEGIGGCEIYNARMASAPCSVGSCKHCGMPLIYHYIIKDVNGKLFAVGCECVNKTGDNGLIVAVEKAKKNFEKGKREIKKQSKRAIQEAARQAEIDARIAKFDSENPLVIPFLTAELEKENPAYIWSSMMYSIRKWGNLSEKQLQCIYSAIEKAKEPVLESNWVGTIGKRSTFENVTVEAVVTVPCTSYSYNDRPSIDIYLMKDDAGNILVYKSKVGQYCDNGMQVIKGSKVNITASVKEHGEYKEKKQTKIQRPKFNAIEVK
jgi:hypothetical protein